MITNAIAHYMNKLETEAEKLDFLTSCELETDSYHLIKFCETLRDELVTGEKEDKKLEGAA